jgi:dipeptidase E
VPRVHPLAFGLAGGRLSPVRLYLSSFRLGDQPQRLVELARGDLTVAVIANACDRQDPGPRRESVQRELDDLTALGFEAVEIDLRDFVGRPQDLRSALARFAVQWWRGGNVFTLRHAISRAGADGVVRELVLTDAVVFAGYSAGACVLAPSLRGLEVCDDATEVTRLYGEEPRFDGLAILDRAVVPHLHSPGHPESAVLGQVALAYERDLIPYLGLRDGQAYVVDGATTQIV